MSVWPKKRNHLYYATNNLILFLVTEMTKVLHNCDDAQMNIRKNVDFEDALNETGKIENFLIY